MRLEPKQVRVVVGPREVLAVARLRLSDVNWLGDRRLSDAPQRVQVKIRNTMAPVPATVEATGLGDVEVEFDAAQQGVSPGQACVFYAADGPAGRVLGGGWILRDGMAPPSDLVA